MSKKIIKDASIYDEYYGYYIRYQKKYGKHKLFIFMMVGGFYEAYSLQYDELFKVSELLNLILTKKDKHSQASESNPYMIGFPSAALNKYLKVLVNNKYTVVVVDQVGSIIKGKRANREVAAIYSQGTYIDDVTSPDTNDIVVLYIEDELQTNGKILTCVGMTSGDFTTGKCIFHESYSKFGDEKYALDETSRFINAMNPREIIIYRKEIENKSTLTKDKLLAYLELSNIHILYYTKININYTKISYQNEIIKKIYKNVGMLSPLEYVDMDMKPYAMISFIALIEFANEHNENIIKYINKPISFDNNQQFILGNNAIQQLNLLSDSSYGNIDDKKYKSVFDVINNTSTPMGRRLLKEILQVPYVHSNDIQYKYNCIEYIIANNLMNKIDDKLKKITDIERAHRKISLLRIHPYEFAKFIKSYKEIIELINIFNEFSNINNNKGDTKNNTKNKIKNKVDNTILKNILPDANIIIQINNFLKYTKDIFVIDELEKYNINDIKDSFFKRDLYPNIDKLKLQIFDYTNYMNDLCTVLSQYITSSDNKNNDTKKNVDNKKKKCNVNKNKNTETNTDIKNTETDDINKSNLKITYTKTEKGGYYLKTTNIRAKSLRENIKDLKTIKINKSSSCNTNSLIFKESKNIVKIMSGEIDEKSDDLIELNNKLMDMLTCEYNKILINVHNKFSELFKEITKYISFMDFINSGAKTAKLNNYVKPKIIDSDNGFIKCKGLRHPIVEKINDDVEYIPHDINIGEFKIGNDENKTTGVILYGLNSSGKSTLMKAIGINQIMAQSGLYVAASEYTYSPYNLLFARITGNDNILKGLSSFELEMTELLAILKRTSKKTLVIGDEVCRGTEYVSGNAIVASTIIQLSETKSSFIFASHLHEIPKMERIKKLDNVKTFHLSVEINKEKDKLIFDRQLKEGSGSTMYGITVAKYIIQDNNFIKLAQEIKNELLGIPNKIVNDKTSKYNSKLYVNECSICGTKFNTNIYGGHIDTHHINEQKNCKDGYVINKPHLKMNSKANLVSLCKKCHLKEHNNKLTIIGYNKTSNGPELKFIEDN